MRISQAVAGVAAATLLVAASPGSAAADTDYWVPADDRLALHGHGYGHGRGMSQHGAQGAALAGLSWQEIIDFYYPGTSLGNSGWRIRVLITDDTTTALRVLPAQRLRLVDLGDGKTWQLPTRDGIDRWELRVSAKDRVFVMYHNNKGWHRWTGRMLLKGEGEFRAAEPITLVLPGEHRRYRGYLRTAKQARNTVNVVSLESYVRGVIPREMPATWKPAAVRAQAVAARSYAVRHRSQARSRYFHVDDTISYQVYGGYSAEHPASDRAVRDTRGKIVMYGGKPALTEFSASSGGWSDGSSLPYQRVKRDPYDDWSGNSVHNWAVTADAGRLESRYPGIGEIDRIRVTRRNGGGHWGGRVELAVLHGSQGQVSVSGNDLRSVLDLRSTWFIVERTPIIRKWHQIGGSDSWVRDVVSGEYVTNGGVGQFFENGRMYHKAGLGAHAVHGQLMDAYARVRGAAGVLGFPVTDRHTAGRQPGTQRISFEHGRIYWSGATGAHEVHGPIMKAYADYGGAAGWLGFPVDDVHRAGRQDGAERLGFEHGRIYRTKSTGAREVHGPIMDAYADVGGAAGRLGFPTTGVRNVGGGDERSDFEHGWIRWDKSRNQATVNYD